MCADAKHSPRRRAKEALGEGVEQFRQVVESQPNGIVIVDAKGRIAFVNAQAEKAFGYTREELLGQAVERLVPQRFRRHHAAYRDGFTARPAARAMGAGRDLYGLRKDGSEFPVEIGLAPIKTEQGLMVLSTIVDITARKRVEKELRESQAQLSGIIDSAMDAIITVDAQQRVVIFNAAAEKLFGYSAEEAIGKPIDRFMPARFRAGHQRHIAGFGRTQVTSRGMGALGKILGLRRNGEEFPIEASISQVEVGGEKYYTVILRDLTEREQYERRLVEAKEQAEDMNRLKSAFLANMSHEIRTPLTGIIGFASVLAQEAMQQHRDFALLIERSGRRLMETLNAVLATAQLEAKRVEVRLEEVPVAEEVRQTVQLFQWQAQQKGLDLAWVMKPGAEAARAHLDRGGLSSIVQNLLGNALKFTDRGSITVSVYADVTSATDESIIREARCVCISVEDTGVGIEPAFMPHLFEPFRQESSGQRRAHEGSGLGLSITARLVELMGGQITVESEKGRGSRFVVSFPLLVRGGEVALERRAREAQGSSFTPSQAQVLLVEDNPETRLLIGHLLRDVCQVQVTSNAEEGLKEARGRQYDLVLLDINLGRGKGGIEVLEALRALPAYRAVPIVAVTAYALPGDRERLLSVGFDAYLNKPFDPQELLQLISGLLVQ